MSQTRRPRVSIYDYPEHLNPFNEEITNSQPQIYRDAKAKEPKNKFWTFGRSRKKRSNSFSIKSTWNGLFGKRKEVPEVQEKRATITTVSSAYKREEPFIQPVASPRVSKDQQEFDEAFGTLARRRKYTLDNSSRYSSTLTVNGDPARIYDGSPQDTTTSIMGNLTPKPPARRFGQISPKPTDKLPPLNFDDAEPKENGDATHYEEIQEKTPVPPLRRFGNRSSQRLNASTFDAEEETNRSADVTLHDENENVPDDYVFKRFSHDAVRRSNLSINSCVSIGSTTSTYRRKKRRAPQPPRLTEPLETPQENVVQTNETREVELQIAEPIDIARVTENIAEMTKKSRDLDEVLGEDGKKPADEPESDKERTEESISKSPDENPENSANDNARCIEEQTQEKINDDTRKCSEQILTENSKLETDESSQTTNELLNESVNEETKHNSLESEKKEDDIQIEYRRTSQDNLEIIKDVVQVNSESELEEVQLRKKGSNGSLSRSDSFCVKEEIEKIEKQIKALETRSSSMDSSDNKNLDELNTRQSLPANRRHFFQNLVDSENGKDSIKIEFKKLPREQKDIHVIRLTDPPVPVAAARDPVKVIELHISEPIKQKPEILEDVNPIPKPRRHSSLNLNGSPTTIVSNDETRCLGSDERGKSV